MSFAISKQADPNKVFLVQCSELEGRHDPFCYIPELVKLDIKLKLKTKYRLKDFAVSYAGGATPKKDIAENYATKENGVPFIRVQNLSVTGELQLDDLVYISRETNEKQLKRSQLKEYDLLVKITGVGRMAVASVVPPSFEGNINQHIVVIRTGSKEISENIAAFLNLDSTEKLASKRATGGTRPALDYTALLSMPVINDPVISEKTKLAVLAKKQKEAEAERLLASIDDYLLAELGISLPPEPENTIKNRIFTRHLSDVSGERLDPKSLSDFYINLRNAISESSFDIQQLSTLILDSKSGDWGIDEDTENNDNSHVKCLVIRATEFDNKFNLNVENTRAKYRLISKHKLTSLNVKANDLLLEKSGGSPDQPVGRIAILDKNLIQDNVVCYSNFIHKFTINSKICLPDYLFCYLKTIHSIGLTESMQSQTNGIRNLIIKEYLNQKIPLPPLPKQQEIAERITAIRNQAKQLQTEAKSGLEKAKAEIEAIILGDAT